MKTQNSHYDNSPHKCLSLELAKEDELYAITINPCDTFQYWKASTHDRIKNAHSALIHQYNDWLGVKFVKLYLESSPTGRLHWHGIISINDLLSFYLVTLRSLQHWCTYEIDTINDIAKWKIYCTKQEFVFNDKNDTRRSIFPYGIELVSYVKEREEYQGANILNYFSNKDRKTYLKEIEKQRDLQNTPTFL